MRGGRWGSTRSERRETDADCVGMSVCDSFTLCERKKRKREIPRVRHGADVERDGTG